LFGASLVVRGYFPWRDFLFTHGLLPDVLTGSLGRAVFGDSVWGDWAIHSVILFPLFWVSVYLFAVWVSRRNPRFLALTFLGMVGGLWAYVERQHVGLPAGSPGGICQPAVVLLVQRFQLLWMDRFIGLPVALIVLGETLRRRRATGGPAEQTFATLVGLELRPRKLREAAVLWERLTEAVGADARDAVWQHPDLLPETEDLDDPAAFIDRVIGGDTSGIDEAIAEFERGADSGHTDPDGGSGSVDS